MCDDLYLLRFDLEGDCVEKVPSGPLDVLWRSYDKELKGW